MMLEEMQDRKAYPLKRTRPIFASEEEYAAAIHRKEGLSGRLPPSPAPSASLEVKASAMRRYISQREGCRIQDVKIGMGLPQSDYESRRNYLIGRGGEHMFYQLRTAGPTLLFTSKRAYDLWMMKQ